MELQQLYKQLLELRRRALLLEKSYAQKAAPGKLPPSASNLLHYLSVRQQDIRPLQWLLSHHGFSSLGDIEPYTMARLNAVISLLGKIAGEEVIHPVVPVDDELGPQLLSRHSEALLGPEPENRAARIMVTMPTVAAENSSLIDDLLAAGMNVMRVNCAHDSPDGWQAMVNHLTVAKQNQSKHCCVQADLAGPKLRTGNIQSSGQVIKLKPRRDLYGHVLQPHIVALLYSEEQALPRNVQSKLVLNNEFLERCKSGCEIEFEDCRGQKRVLSVVAAGGAQFDGFVAELYQTAYLSNKTQLKIKHNLKGTVKKVVWGNVLNIPDVVQPILLQKGDQLVLTRDSLAGSHARTDHFGKAVITPARIHCTLPEAFEQVKAGHQVWFDDGKMGGIVKKNTGAEILVDMTHTAPEGNKLREEKGINFPDTRLNIPALTEKDLENLTVVSQWADIIALSFVRCAEDVRALHEKLVQLDKPNIGIVLKIENRQAFESLPSILLEGIKLGRPFGVMIARGDLAVEVGFERLSEVQQEILWLCEAAHVPVVWATQILESMAKRGLPSRAEVSDAGMGVMAECAMLNKGPYILETVALLKGILQRMDGHYHKRRATLRKLTVAEFDPPH